MKLASVQLAKCLSRKPDRSIFVIMCPSLAMFSLSIIYNIVLSVVSMVCKLEH